MTVLSQNGWSANDRSVIGSYALPGGRIALRAGDVSVVLLWVANRFHKRVERLEWPGNWGYAERNIRGSSTTLSNHASGTAIDLNAPRHPLGVRGTFSASQVRAIHDIVASTGGAVRWGGDYRGRVDEMHFEINAGAAAVKAAADRFRGAIQPPPPTPRPTRMEDDVVYIRCQLNPSGPESIAILTGAMFVGLGSPREIQDAQRAMAAGAPSQWVERLTWQELDKRSHALCDNPRPVAVNSQPATSS